MRVHFDPNPADSAGTDAPSAPVTDQAATPASNAGSDTPAPAVITEAELQDAIRGMHELKVQLSDTQAQLAAAQAALVAAEQQYAISQDLLGQANEALAVKPATAFPVTDQELQQHVADTPKEELRRLYQAGGRLQELVNDRWQNR